MAPTQGRPPSDNPKTERLFIRVTPQEKAEIQSFTKQSGFSLLELIRKGIEAVKQKQSFGTPWKRLPKLPQFTPNGAKFIIAPSLVEIKEEFFCAEIYQPAMRWYGQQSVWKKEGLIGAKNHKKGLDKRIHNIVLYMWIQKGGDTVSPKGRPTNDPKVLNTRIRLSEEDIQRLKYCAEATGLTKSEIIRQGIKEVYDKLKKEKQPATCRGSQTTSKTPAYFQEVYFIVSQPPGIGKAQFWRKFYDRCKSDKVPS